MPAATYYNTEDLWSDAVLTVLAAGGTGVPTVNIMTPRSSVTAGTPRIEIQALNDARASNQMAFKSDGTPFYIHRAIDIDVLIATDRHAATAQDHGAIRGRVRYLFSDEAASQIGRDNDDAHREDHSRLTFRCEYGLLPSAYPTPA